MNPENYWVVSLTVISYKILGGIIKQVTCQLLEIGIAITRNHAKLTSFVFSYNAFTRLPGPRKPIGIIVLTFQVGIYKSPNGIHTAQMRKIDTNHIFR